MTEDVKRAVDGLRHCAAASIANVQGCDTCPVIGECLDIDYPHRIVALVDQLTAELEQVTRERDAAVQDIYMTCMCDVCTRSCKYDKPNPYCECADFEWRGVCAENGGAEDA